MKIFLDTNIFLDLLLKRDGAKESALILNSCYENIFQGFISDITLLNIDYIASKQATNVYDFLKLLNDTFKIIGFDNKMFDLVLKIDNDDLEDSVQYICAKDSDCEIIITNDKNFYRGKIKVVTSREFIRDYLS